MFPNHHRDDENPLLTGLRPETAAWLQEGLRDLRDVPKHGLSNERLRDRLLATGLDAKPAPANTPWWAWALAPAAAALVALAVVPNLASRFRPTPAPQLVGPALATPEPPVTLAFGDRRGTLLKPAVPQALPKTPALKTVVPKTVVPKTVVTEARGSTTVVARRPRVRFSTPTRPAPGTEAPARSNPQHATAPPPRTPNFDTRVALNDAPLVTEPSTALLAPPMPLASLASVSTSAEPVTLRLRPAVSPSVGARPKSDPLVILASEIDADTGAVAATEVDSHKNVSVGG